ncbi:MAG: 5-bromo-4-chloroindolyl phosphate hydrolysis family protein [Clostridia bacterium]|nr:5-bromo-4-chloroindolyl phosphate hydrolysis family protein [Clostridia bacterium]
MDDRNYRRINIPSWVIFLLFFINIPLAVILLIVRSIKIPVSGNQDGKQQSARDAGTGPARSSATDAAQSAPQKGSGDSSASQKNDKKKTRMTAGVIISLVLGIIFAAASLGSAISLSTASLFEGLIKIASFAAVSLGSFGSFFVLNGRRKREARYAEWVSDRDVYDLRTLSYVTGLKSGTVIRDMKRMTASGAFGPKAFIDETEMKFFRSPEIAEQFKKDRDRFSKNTGGAKTVDDYTKILLDIRRLNDEIADPSVSREISKIEEQTRYIFGYVSDHPEKRSNINTFMNYYLPTTLKLLESYAQLEKMGEGGDNMQKSKEGIEGILSMLSDGFVRQTDQLFASESIDISSDIEVLETMMKKDGLTGTRDFDLGGSAAAAPAPEGDIGKEIK